MLMLARHWQRPTKYGIHLKCEYIQIGNTPIAITVSSFVQYMLIESESENGFL